MVYCVRVHTKHGFIVNRGETCKVVTENECDKVLAAAVYADTIYI